MSSIRHQLDSAISGTTSAATDLVDGAVSSAEHAIRASQQALQQSLDMLASQVDAVRAQALPVLDRLDHDARATTRRGMNALRHVPQHLRDGASQASESTTAFIRHDPIKSVLLGAAVGAVLMGLATLTLHSDHRRD